MIQMRFIRRHSIYTVGDVAVFPLSAARQLHAMRVAEGLAELVPTVPPGAPEGTLPASPVPERQPGSVVRK